MAVYVFSGLAVTCKSPLLYLLSATKYLPSFMAGSDFLTPTTITQLDPF